MAQLNRGRVSDPAQAALSGSQNEAPGSAGGISLRGLGSDVREEIEVSFEYMLQGAELLMRFVQDFDSRDGRVVHNWLKGNVELTLRGRLQVVKGLGQSMKTACFFIDIKVIEQRASIAQNAKHPAPVASNSRRAGPEIKLRKVQGQSVAIARVNRNGVGKVPISLR